jgi:hypothetical protein
MRLGAWSAVFGLHHRRARLHHRPEMTTVTITGTLGFGAIPRSASALRGKGSSERDSIKSGGASRRREGSGESGTSCVVPHSKTLRVTRRSRQPHFALLCRRHVSVSGRGECLLPVKPAASETSCFTWD